MQTAVQVFCKEGRSLRNIIANQTRKLEAHEFQVLREKITGRSPGWMKIRSTTQGVWGALSISWDSATQTLICRVVNKKDRTPNRIVGRFVEFLLRHHGKRIKLISIFEV